MKYFQIVIKFKFILDLKNYIINKHIKIEIIVVKNEKNKKMKKFYY